MDNHSSSSSPTSCFLFENTNGSIYPSDLVLTMMEDGSSPSSSFSSSSSTNGSLSPSSSHHSLGMSSSSSAQMSFPCCVFHCRPNSHPFQERCIPLNEAVKVGRAVARLKALPNNAIFDCKVLSRQHAKLWYESGKVRTHAHADVDHARRRARLVFTARYEEFEWNVCEQSTIRQMQ